MEFHQHVLSTVQGTHPVVIAGDTMAVSIAAASWMGYLPNIAAVLSIIYLLIQIPVTIDNWINRRRLYKDKDD